MDTLYLPELFWSKVYKMFVYQKERFDIGQSWTCQGVGWGVILAWSLSLCSTIIDKRKLCLVQIVIKCKEGCQEHLIILMFLMNLRRLGEWFWWSWQYFIEFNEYLVGFILINMMSDFNKYVRKEGSRRGCWWMLGGLESLLEEFGSFKITQASLLDLLGVL